MPVVSNVEVDGIVRAVRAIHDITTSNEQRFYFTQVCLDFNAFNFEKKNLGYRKLERRKPI